MRISAEWVRESQREHLLEPLEFPGNICLIDDEIDMQNIERLQRLLPYHRKRDFSLVLNRVVLDFINYRKDYGPFEKLKA